jgi:hypothetical protein
MNALNDNLPLKVQFNRLLNSVAESDTVGSGFERLRPDPDPGLNKLPNLNFFGVQTPLLFVEIHTFFILTQLCNTKQFQDKATEKSKSGYFGNRIRKKQKSSRSVTLMLSSRDNPSVSPFQKD